jgi:hypothetical protein
LYNHILANFEANRSLARNYEPIVEGRHEHRTSLLRDAPCYRLAIIFFTVEKNDFGTMRFRALNFRQWRITWHHNHGWHSPHPGSAGNTLCMIA